MQGTHNKIEQTFFGTVKLNLSGGQVFVFWSSLQFFSCHRRPDECGYGSLQQV